MSNGVKICVASNKKHKEIKKLERELIADVEKRPKDSQIWFAIMAGGVLDSVKHDEDFDYDKDPSEIEDFGYKKEGE